jgi:putative hydrolase of the HAD superfamily
MIRGIIFDLGWTLLEFQGDILAMAGRRAEDLGGFLRAQGFDLDGTVVFEDYQAEGEHLWQAGTDLNYEYPARLAMLRALRRHLAPEHAAQLAREALAASFQCIIPRWRLYPDAMDVVRALHSAGYRVGCISNTNDGAHVQRMVDYYGLRPWLEPVYTSAEVGLRKPHPAIFTLVLDQWGLTPDEVVMVGDTLDADVLGAHNVGMWGIWVDRGLVNPWSENEESRGKVLPNATIQRLDELPGLLEEGWGPWH